MSEGETPNPEHSKAQRDADAHYAAVGRVASAWASFELKVDMLAIALSGIHPPLGYCFTAQVAGSARKVDAYIAIARLKGSEMGKELEDFAKDTAALAERRNRIVHDPWFVLKDATVRFEITARRKLRSMSVVVPTSDVQRCFADIMEHGARLGRLHQKIEKEIAALPPPRPKPSPRRGPSKAT